jgi:hypothetical protein
VTMTMPSVEDFSCGKNLAMDNIPCRSR